MSGAWIIGIGLLALGLACGVTSTAIDYWYYHSATNETANGHFGLWEICVKITNTTSDTCTSWSSLDDQSDEVLDITWVHACQAMMVIGAVLNLAACVATIYAKMKQMATRIAQFAAGVAGVCYLIAASIFGAKYEDSISDGQTGGNLHAGFGLAIVAGLINLISIGVLARVQKTGSYELV